MYGKKHHLCQQLNKRSENVKIKSQSHNWLVHRIAWNHLSEVIPLYAGKRVLDIGCSDKPYESLFLPHVMDYIGLDHAESQHNLRSVDIIADAYNTTVRDASFDTILSTSVLEHLERPQDAILEMHRVLKPGGHVIVTCPLFWHLHEQPRDFFRYTKYGLRFLFEKAGFEIIEIRPLSGFVVTFAQEFVYFLQSLNHNTILRNLINILQFIIQKTAYFLNRYDKSYDFTWMYLLIAKKSV